MLFYSTRNEPEKSHFLPIRKFKPDQLFFICLILSVFPLLMIVFEKTVNLSEISHPFSYAIAVAFKGKEYLTVLVGILTISITTAIIEESFFRGILLRDYFTLGKFGRFALLAFAAFYFAISHIPISFMFPLLFAIFINRLRLAYNNLLPGMILHAIWNTCVTIAILTVLNTNPVVEVIKTFEKFAPEISVIWKSKHINDAKTFYPQYEISDKNFYTFTEKDFDFFVITENTNEYKISWMMLNLKNSVPSEKIQVSYPSDDWKTSTFKKLKDHKKIEQELTCSEKIDLCFKPNPAGIKKIYFGLFNSKLSL